MTEHDPTAPDVPPTKIVLGRVTVEFINSTGEVRRNIQRMRDFAHNLGGIVHASELVEVVEEPEMEPLTEAAEDELHRELDKTLEEILCTHEFGSDPQKYPPPSDPRFRFITKIVNKLDERGVSTLRDVLLAGRYFVVDTPKFGEKAYDVVEQTVKRVVGSSEEWLGLPNAGHAARWCAGLYQVKGFVIGPQYMGVTLQEMVELGITAADPYAKDFLIARRQLVAARRTS